MNLPNMLTLLRILLCPVFLLLLILNFPYHYFAALLVFVVASVTDLLDGYIARKRHLVTDFGKFLDPIADKLLIAVAFLGFLVNGVGFGTVWITAIVLAREFLVSSVRMIAAAGGRVVAADIWGKTKTVCQMTAVILTLFCEGLLAALGAGYPGLTCVFHILCNAALWISAVMTVISGINYLVKNRDFIDPKK